MLFDANAKGAKLSNIMPGKDAIIHISFTHQGKQQIQHTHELLKKNGIFEKNANDIFIYREY